MVAVVVVVEVHHHRQLDVVAAAALTECRSSSHCRGINMMMIRKARRGCRQILNFKLQLPAAPIFTTLNLLGEILD
jgi:hypothetical protein